MNQRIRDYYRALMIQGNASQSDIEEAMLTAIRCDDGELLGACLARYDGKDEDLPSFAIKEMASYTLIDMLVEHGYDLPSNPDITPFSGTPENLVDAIMRTEGKSRKEALSILLSDVSYYLRVLTEDYSCYRIPFNISPEDIHKPSFFSYLAYWLADFAPLIAGENPDSLIYLLCSIVRHPELGSALHACLSSFPESIFTAENVNKLLDIAIRNDNEEAFTMLMERNSRARITTYPKSSLSILNRLFDMGILIPKTRKAFAAFRDFISYEEVDEENEDILIRIMHPSYAGWTDNYGNTILSLAIRNRRFEPSLYHLLIPSPEILDRHDKNGRTALFLLAESEYPEAMEILIRLGANPFLQDCGGRNVLHVMIDEESVSIGTIEYCMGFLPKELMDIHDNDGKTPLDLLKELLLNAASCDKAYSQRFQDALPTLLKGAFTEKKNILIAGNSKETREKVSMNIASYLTRKYVDFQQYDASADDSDKLIPILDVERPIIIWIDELADILQKDGGESIIHQLSRKSNILFIASTAYASADIVTVSMLEAFPIRISSALTSQMNSFLVFGSEGAEMLSDNELMVRTGDGCFICWLSEIL